jgi:hypothetical protein
MKRFVSAVLVAAVALSVAGCSKAPTTTAGAGSSQVATSPAAPTIPVPKTWKAMPLGAQEKKRLDTLAGPLALYVSMETKANRTPVKLAGLTPRFVGYQVQIFATQANGKVVFAYIDVIDSRIDAMGDMQRPLEAKMVGLIKDQPRRYSSSVVPQSAGEKEAVAKSVQWAKAAFPGIDWKAEIAGYDFYFGLAGNKYLLFTANANSDGYRTFGGAVTK